ncbi:MAG: hypothetical protein AAF387_20540, partial [Pseudomonadota bacterium]
TVLMTLLRSNLSFSLSLLLFTQLLSLAANATLIDRGNGLIYDDVLDITWLKDANYAFTSGYAAANARESADIFADDNIFPDGRMGWAAALQWADELDYGGYNDWRLPAVRPINGIQFLDGEPGTPFAIDGTADLGFAFTGIGWVDHLGQPASELGHLFYVTLNNLGICDPTNPIGARFNDNLRACLATPQPGSGFVNGGPFMNVATDQSDSYWTDREFPTFPESVISFRFGTGFKATDHWDEESFAWAVRDGDVANAATTVPEPGSLCLALAAILGLRSKKRVPTTA